MVAGRDLEYLSADIEAGDELAGEGLHAVGRNEGVAAGGAGLRGGVEELVLGVEHVEQGTLVQIFSLYVLLYIYP